MTIPIARRLGLAAACVAALAVVGGLTASKALASPQTTQPQFYPLTITMAGTATIVLRDPGAGFGMPNPPIMNVDSDGPVHFEIHADTLAVAKMGNSLRIDVSAVSPTVLSNSINVQVDHPTGKVSIKKYGGTDETNWGPGDEGSKQVVLGPQ